MSKKHSYYSGSDIVRISGSLFVGATYEMHVAAKVLVGNVHSTTVTTSVFTFDAEEQLFLKHCTADIAQSADRIASALNACVNVKPENLTLGRIETLVMENAKQRHTINVLESKERLQAEEISRLRRDNLDRVVIQGMYPVNVDFASPASLKDVAATMEKIMQAHPRQI